jgi:hypothetical protein
MIWMIINVLDKRVGQASESDTPPMWNTSEAAHLNHLKIKYIDITIVD